MSDTESQKKLQTLREELQQTLKNFHAFYEQYGRANTVDFGDAIILTFIEHGWAEIERVKMGKDDESILLYAFRYTLGRRTYAVSQVAEEIIRRKGDLSEAMKERVLQEIGEQEKRKPYGLGDQCDVDAWHKVRDTLTGV